MKRVKGLSGGRVRKWGRERYGLIKTQDYETHSLEANFYMKQW